MNWNNNTGNQPDEHNESVSYKIKYTIMDVKDEDSESTSSFDANGPHPWTADLNKKIKQSKTEAPLAVFDVAQYILKKTGSITTMKLQKLIYYCQVWSLVWDEKVLFSENIEAWANGPVVKELFNHHRGMFHISSVTIGNPDILNTTQKETIDAVLDYYGDKPSQWLIDLTHNEAPWKNARAGMDISERGNIVIKLDDMAEYYSSLQSE